MGSLLRESTVQSYIREEVNKLGWARLIRNNVGRVQDMTGQWHQFGLGKGSADLVGFVQMENGLARVFAIEVKRPGKYHIEPEQIAWITALNKRGGAGAICTSPHAAVLFAKEAKTGKIFQGAPILE